MAKSLENRILRIGRRTHSFVSHAALCRVRDYFEARLEQVEKPPDLEEKFQELMGLLEAFSRTKDPTVRTRFQELCRSSEAIWLKMMIPEVRSAVDSSPMGVWLLKCLADMYIKNAADAKEYLAEKKRKEENAQA